MIDRFKDNACLTFDILLPQPTVHKNRLNNCQWLPKNMNYLTERGIVRPKRTSSDAVLNYYSFIHSFVLQQLPAPLVPHSE